MKKYLIIMCFVLLILNLIQYFIWGLNVVLVTYLGAFIGIAICYIPIFFILMIIKTVNRFI